MAKRDGLTVTNLIAEAIYIHLHRLETRSDPAQRRKSVCWGCGKKMDASAEGAAKSKQP